MDDLIVFVSARLDEDEAALRAVEDDSEPWRGQWAPDDMNFALRTRNGWSLARAVTVEEGFPPGVLAHIVRHDPARVLREVEAGRALVAEYRRALEKAPGNRPMLSALVRLVRGRAAVWCDHPDYRAGWKP